MADGPSTVQLAVNLVVSLTVVIGLLVGGAWLVRKQGTRLGLLAGGAAGRKGGIKVLDRTPVTRGSSVLLIQVGDRTMVVGATEQGMSLLAEGDDLKPADDGAEQADAPQAARQLAGLVDRVRERTVRRAA